MSTMKSIERIERGVAVGARNFSGKVIAENWLKKAFNGLMIWNSKNDIPLHEKELEEIFKNAMGTFFKE